MTDYLTALVGAGGAAFGALVTWFALGKRIQADERLAEKRFEFDKAIAERKFALDRDLHDHKRKVELAEVLVANFLQAHDVIRAVRSPGAYLEEGAERERQPNEDDNQRRTMDTYYVPLARLSRNSEFISGLMSKRYQARALLGSETDQAFQLIHEVIVEIQVSAQSLIRSVSRGQKPYERNESHWQRCESAIWEGLAETDTISTRVQSAIERIEAICRPILERGN